MSAEPQVTISEEYDATLFTSAEYNCRLESKTKFIIIELEGSNLCIRIGKTADGKVEETKLKKFSTHEAALAELTKEFKSRKKAYPIKDDTGSKKLSELELPSLKRGPKGKKKDGEEESEEASVDANTEKDSAVSAEEVGEKRKSTSDNKDEESLESDAKKQKIEKEVDSDSTSKPTDESNESVKVDDKSIEAAADKQQTNGEKTEEKKMEDVTVVAAQ